MTTLLEYLRLFLLRWFGYDPKPCLHPNVYRRNGEPCVDCGENTKPIYSTTTKDGQFIGPANAKDCTQDIINAIKEAAARHRSRP